MMAREKKPRVEFQPDRFEVVLDNGTKEIVEAYTYNRGLGDKLLGFYGKDDEVIAFNIERVVSVRRLCRDECTSGEFVGPTPSQRELDADEDHPALDSRGVPYIGLTRGSRVRHISDVP